MNYYNPYFTAMPYTPTLGMAASGATSKGLLGSLFGGGKFSSFINGTQKTLSIINQAIPLVKQVSPVVKNAKTMFKVMNEFKKVDNPTTTQSNVSTQQIVQSNEMPTDSNNYQYSNDNGPTFFI